MRNRALIAALLATTCVSAPAFAADLGPALKAPPPPVPVADWTGFYIGLEGGYGWGHTHFDAVTNFGPVFGAPDLSALFNPLGPGSVVVNPPFVTTAPVGSPHQNGGVFGGFVGVQKQLSGSGWVLGLEADFDGADIKGSAAATATEFGVLATSLFIGQAPVTVAGSGTAFVTATTFTVFGQTITSTGTFTPSGSVSISPSTISIATQTLTVPAETLTVAAQTLTTSPSFSGSASTLTITSVTALGTLTTLGSTITVNATITVSTLTLTPSGSVTPSTLSVAGTTLTVAPTTLSVTGQTVTISPTASFSGSLATISVTGATTAQTITIPPQNAPVTVTAAGSTTPSVIQVGQTTVDVMRSVAITTKIDELGSVRGKIGFSPFTNWLFYGTGGLGWAHAQNTLTLTQTLFQTGTPIVIGTPSVFTSTSSSTLLGWAVGAGVDWKITPYLVIGAEYLHYDFPKNTIAFSDNSASVRFGNSHQTVDTIKGRISWFVPLFP